MTLAEIVRAERVFPRIRVADKTALLNDLAKRAATQLGLPVTEVGTALAAREALGSTGVGAGIALPHARLDAVQVPAGFFARLDRAIDFAAIDRRPVDLVFLLLSPTSGDTQHLTVLAAVSRRLRDKTAADAIRAAADADEIRNLLVGGS